LADTSATARAEANFRKKQAKQREGDAALAHYRAEARATDEKTARLRALRLAKEAADREAALLAPPPEPAKAKKATKKKPRA
jgi:hypothetical protein